MQWVIAITLDQLFAIASCIGTHRTEPAAALISSCPVCRGALALSVDELHDAAQMRLTASTAILSQLALSTHTDFDAMAMSQALSSVRRLVDEAAEFVVAIWREKGHVVNTPVQAA
ncbi:hypothetical protein EC912_1141 [Luteibacter rhizovicinus]|uniref:Uncharacterized protein n=1 Tax=Luteibacter rhizovicinus TaxID=242606 RepID=A0A4V2W398_9GAMM|nr:hypothetical protein [Luteibacter rhizovicinus]TCV91099.1 hypothetical protein EC912_1141 [Luteibacter rhizovicinus]